MLVRRFDGGVGDGIEPWGRLSRRVEVFLAIYGDRSPSDSERVEDCTRFFPKARTR